MEKGNRLSNRELAQLITTNPGSRLHLRSEDLNFGYITLDNMAFANDLLYKANHFPCYFTVATDSENIFINHIAAAI